MVTTGIAASPAFSASEKNQSDRDREGGSEQQRPLAFPGFTERATLDTGDYSVVETAEICVT
jgi:hypothetical protein